MPLGAAAPCNDENLKDAKSTYRLPVVLTREQVLLSPVVDITILCCQKTCVNALGSAKLCGYL